VSNPACAVDPNKVAAKSETATTLEKLPLIHLTPRTASAQFQY
jgi:hypothetical protein